MPRTVTDLDGKQADLDTIIGVTHNMQATFRVPERCTCRGEHCVENLVCVRCLPPPNKPFAPTLCCNRHPRSCKSFTIRAAEANTLQSQSEGLAIEKGRAAQKPTERTAATVARL